MCQLFQDNASPAVSTCHKDVQNSYFSYHKTNQYIKKDVSKFVCIALRTTLKVTEPFHSQFSGKLSKLCGKSYKITVPQKVGF